MTMNKFNYSSVVYDRRLSLTSDKLRDFLTSFTCMSIDIKLDPGCIPTVTMTIDSNSLDKLIDAANVGLAMHMVASKYPEFSEKFEEYKTLLRLTDD